MNNCVFCNAEMPDDSPLISHWDYADNEYPKRYTHVCYRCMEQCIEGKRTKEEFLELVGKAIGL